MFFEVLFVLGTGLIVGSFLNALVYRAGHNELIITGRSKCPSCKHQLAWRDLIPLVSFVLLLRRCRYCRGPISWRYFFGEGITALCLLWLYFLNGLSMDFFYFSIITFFLIVIFFTDFYYYLIPDKVSFPAIIVVTVIQILRGADISMIGLAVLIGGGFFFIQYVVSHGRWVGGGDIRLGILMGIILGFPFVLIALAMAYVIGALFGVISIVTKFKKISSQIQFGTFLTGATFITLLYGEQIVKMYAQLVGFE